MIFLNIQKIITAHGSIILLIKMWIKKYLLLTTSMLRYGRHYKQLANFLFWGKIAPIFFGADLTNNTLFIKDHIILSGKLLIPPIFHYTLLQIWSQGYLKKYFGYFNISKQWKFFFRCVLLWVLSFHKSVSWPVTYITLVNIVG